MWVYGIGYLLVYGTILAKMWRVYQIFYSPNPNKDVSVLLQHDLVDGVVN